MNRAIWLTLAALAFTVGLSAQSVKYSVDKASDMDYGTLRATVNGKTYTVIDKSKQMCLAIADQRDWDGNGLTDALIENITACGGNCCPNSYFFVSAMPNGRFVVSDNLADSWQDPKIQKWNGAWSVVIVSSNEGENTERPKEVTRRFVLRDGKGVRVDESVRKDMESVVEMRSENFKVADEEHSIKYDLDGDGKPDVISGKFWERWGRIIWSVRFANGKNFSSDDACKRIGVLKTSSNGVHDLVCDQDTVYRWTGSGYSAGNDTASAKTPTAKPSFDCAKAATKVEMLICRDETLASLEVDMASAYREALHRLPAPGQAALRRDHIAWFKDYSRNCNASANEADRASCISNWLTSHTADLKNRKQ